jgi:uncharacterized paraquat-inducible protein A
VTTMPLLPRLGRPCLVDEIRCPHCGVWVKARKFDLAHMACKRCRRTLARPRWSPLGWWLR